MARYLGPKLRLSRREGEDLELKSGIRNIDQKCHLKNRPGDPPKTMRPRASDYQTHLRAKQKMRRYYGVLEKQFRNYYKKAARSRGDTGTNLFGMLERRLDNVVYRLGFARTRAEARQLVTHNLVTVDKHRVNRPSFQLKNDQIVAIVLNNRKSDKLETRIKDAIIIAEQRSQIDIPWLEADHSNYSGKIMSEPDKTILGIFFDESKVVEYYSK